MLNWKLHDDCKKCNKTHSVHISEKVEPEDDAVYAYICPETQEESKFRWKYAAWTEPSAEVPKCSIPAYKSSA